MEKKKSTSLNTESVFKASNFCFFHRYSEGTTELQPSTLQAMQASGDKFTAHEALN